MCIYNDCVLIDLGGHHSISRIGGGGESIYSEQIIYFSPARRKFYILLHVHIEQFLKFIIYILQKYFRQIGRGCMF